jgi:tripartite-type tricarboxylate transporter receptor subunit TctC
LLLSHIAGGVRPERVSERITQHRQGSVMNLPRRHFLHLAGAAAAAAASQRASALDYPVKPVRIIVGFPPGTATDITARLIGQWLSDRLGQPFIIENRPGAGSNTATEASVRAAADGYTLLLVGATNAINATLYEKLSFNYLRDIVPIGGLIRAPYVIVVNPQLPAKTVPEFIAFAKANPGKINMASSGVGTGNHLSGEMFKVMTGIDMIHIPYRGDVFSDLIGGQVQVYFGAMVASIEFIKAGKLRPLAVTTATRSSALPDVPTVAEFVPGYEASAWYGLSTVRNTPAEVIEKLNKEINAAISNPKMNARFADLAGSAIPGSPAGFGKLIADETKKWGKVIQAANIKL